MAVGRSSRIALSCRAAVRYGMSARPSPLQQLCTLKGFNALSPRPAGCPSAIRGQRTVRDARTSWRPQCLGVGSRLRQKCCPQGTRPGSSTLGAPTLATQGCCTLGLVCALAAMNTEVSGCRCPTPVPPSFSLTRRSTGHPTAGHNGSLRLGRAAVGCRLPLR